MKITTTFSVGIIGGKGKTGSQFAKIWKSAGFRVRTTDARTKRQNAHLLATCDIIIFSVPLSSSVEIIKAELKQATRKDQLILDVSSLKVDQTEAMLSAPGEVIGMHPLFGPSTDPKGETVILCPGRATSETLRSLIAFFKAIGMKTKVMTPKDHDDLMTTVQVIPHLKSFLMADALRMLGADFNEALKSCTPTYQMEFNVIGRFLDDHPDLYMPIIFRNPGTKNLLKVLRSLIDEYIRIAEEKDLSSAEDRYVHCKQFFASHLKRARTQSEACIQTLLSLSR